MAWTICPAAIPSIRRAGPEDDELIQSLRVRAIAGQEGRKSCVSRIVKRIAKKNFERVNRRDLNSILKDCVANIHHRFGGHHALGAERHDREALKAWHRLAPDMKLTVRDVWVKGLPYNTVFPPRLKTWTMVDTMATPCSYSLLPVALVWTGYKLKPFKIINVWDPSNNR